jgi:hypothetical protein
MTLEQVRDVFLSVLPDATFHYYAWSKPDKYIVWAEDGQADSAHSDNKMKLMALQGTADYYTKQEYDPIVDQIEETMNNSRMSWRLNSVQYEEETGYIHHEWVWEVNKSIG